MDDDVVGMPGRRHRRTLVGGAVTLALVAAVCTGSQPVGDAEPVAQATATPTAAPSPTPTPTPRPSPTLPTWAHTAPLTGFGTDDGDAVNRRVVAIKLDNHDLARPQTGLNRADAVLELPVESGLTRFIALFHTDDVPDVGPVRSGRPTDPTLVRALGGPLLISGAQPWIVSLIRRQGVPLFVDIGEGITFRQSGRSAPHNLHADTEALRQAADGRGIDDAPPPVWFPRTPADPDQPPSADDVRRVTLPWSDATTVVWDWRDDGQWERTHNGRTHRTVTADGSLAAVEADHLVVLHGRRYTARSPVDGGGLPALDTVGTGDAWVVIGGERPHVIVGSWSRDSIEDVPVVVDTDGALVRIPPGRLWVSWYPSTRSPSFADRAGDHDVDGTDAPEGPDGAL